MMENGLMYGYHLGVGWMLLSIVFWVAVIVGIVMLVLWGVRKSGKWADLRKEDSPLDILNRRYAQGEINKEQYREMKKDILER